MVRDEARLRRGHNDQSRWGHQCSKTTLTGESWFHIIIPLGFEPGSLMTRSKRVNHWTSRTVCECSEIAGSPYCLFYTSKCMLYDSILDQYYFSHIRSTPEDRNPGVVVRSDNDFCYIRAINIKSITIPIRLEE